MDWLFQPPLLSPNTEIFEERRHGEWSWLSIFVLFGEDLVPGQAKGAEHHGGALQADGELVHQTGGKAPASNVEDGLSPQTAFVSRRGAPYAEKF